MAEMDTFFEDLLENVSQTSDELRKASDDSKGAIAKTYDMQARTLMAYYEQTDKIENERDRMALERYKIDEDLKLRREIEERRLEIEQKKSNAERGTLWAKVGISLAELGLTAGMGLLYLKANMKYGGMVGKDAQKWFNDLKHIKL